MQFVSIWIQQKLRKQDFFSSALFCIWLSTASLLPSLVLVADASRPTAQQASHDRRSDPVRPVVRAEIP